MAKHLDFRIKIHIYPIKILKKYLNLKELKKKKTKKSLNNDTNVLFTAGGGCRYRYYAEITETILRDLGYDFEFYKLISNGKLTIIDAYKLFKDINKNLSFYKFTHSILYTLFFVFYMDKIDIIIRKNIGFKIEKNSHIHLQKKMLNDFKNTNSIIKLSYLYFKYKRLFKKIKINKLINPLKVGIIGELYTSMEPFSNYFLENYLAKENIEIKRYTNLSYLLWQKNLKYDIY